MRIASLIASATEMVAALGLADKLVGISHECDWPPEAVKGRAILTSPKMNVTKCSLDIHKDVQEIVAKGLSVYNIDVEKLRQVKPDIIITQDQCDVCAVTYEDVVKATQMCLQNDAKIVTLHPDALEDIFKDILKVGEALGVSDRAQKLVQEIQGKIGDVPLRYTPRGTSPKPRVVCLEWLNPLMVAGNWIPEMVEMAGGINGITKKGDHTKVIEWRELKEYDPDILILMPCGFKIEQTLENRSDLENLAGFSDLKAVKTKKVFVVDGNAYMNRPGPRILESFYILAGIFHPDLFKRDIPNDAVILLGT